MNLKVGDKLPSSELFYLDQNNNVKKRNIIKAFQRHFRQNLINGISDQECLLISKDLLKS